MCKLQEKNEKDFEPYKIETKFREMQKELKDAKRKLVESSQEIEDLLKVKVDFTVEHESQLKKLHDRHEMIELENYSLIAAKDKSIAELREKLRLSEDNGNMILKLSKQKKDLETQIDNLVLGVDSEESEEESEIDKAEQQRQAEY